MEKKYSRLALALLSLSLACCRPAPVLGSFRHLPRQPLRIPGTHDHAVKHAPVHHRYTGLVWRLES